jgi:hypothetical protein
VITIITGSTPRTSCRRFVSQAGNTAFNLPVHTVFDEILIINLRIYKFNTSVHDINTRNKQKLYKPTVRLSACQKSAYYNSINIYNNLPNTLAELVSSRTSFISNLKKYLIDNPFYSLDE